MKTSEALQKIFYRPTEVFVAIKEQPDWLPAMLVLLAVVVVQSALISHSVARAYTQHEPLEAEREHYEALKDVFGDEFDSIQDSERRGIVVADGTEGSATVTKVVFVRAPGLGPIGFNVTVASLAFLIALGIEVTYFRIIGSKMRLPLKTVNWIAFTVWSRIPATGLALFGVILVLLGQGYQTNVANYELFSFARWIPLPIPLDRNVNLLNIDVDHLDASLIWVIALQAIGFRVWSGRRFSVSLAVVAFPTVILYIVVLWLSMDPFH